MSSSTTGLSPLLTLPLTGNDIFILSPVDLNLASTLSSLILKIHSQGYNNVNNRGVERNAGKGGGGGGVGTTANGERGGGKISVAERIRMLKDKKTNKEKGKGGEGEEQRQSA